MGADGYPRSWRLYVYGCARLARAGARADLRAASAASVPHWDAADRKTWYNDRTSLARWR